MGQLIHEGMTVRQCLAAFKKQAAIENAAAASIYKWQGWSKRPGKRTECGGVPAILKCAPFTGQKIAAEKTGMTDQATSQNCRRAIKRGLLAKSGKRPYTYTLTQIGEVELELRGQD